MPTRFVARVLGHAIRVAGATTLLVATITLRAHAQPVPLVAVWPFAGVSDATEQAFLADGLTDDLRSALSFDPGLRVIGAQSMARYGGQAVGLGPIAAELGARYVLDGSVRRDGKMLDVMVQLVDTSDGSHLFVARYTEVPANLFAIRDALIRRTLRALTGRTAEIEAAAPISAATLRAFELTAHARARLRSDASNDARDLIEQAAIADPDYLPALLVRTTVYLALNDPDTALAAARRALALAPTHPAALAALAEALAGTGRDDEARIAGEAALAAAPRAADILATVAQVFDRAGAPDRALAAYGRLLEVEPFPDGATAAAFAAPRRRER